jgi:methylglutaconyl-CoA hydratase
MSENGSLTVATSNNVSTICFFHEKANCFPLSLLQELSSAIRKCSNDTSSRVIFIKSDGAGAFSAGASFEEFKRIKTPQEAEEFFWGFANVMLAMRDSPKPIVLRVHGKVVGGGLGIVSCADYVIAHSSAAIRLSEIGLGIGPFTIGLGVERRIGNARFSALVLDAQWRSANWALESGLYSQVCESQEQLEDQLAVILVHLASLDPETLRANRKMLWEGTSYWDQLFKDRVETVSKLLLRGSIGN